MRILILGMNYAPESTGIAPYTTDFAEYLAERGHEVHVVTARPHFPQWRVWDDYRGKSLAREQANGVYVHRTYVYVPKKPRKVLNRLLYDSTFSISVLVRGLFMRRCDFVFVVSPPVQIGLSGWLVAARHRAPLFFHVQDIVSRAVVGTGMVGEMSLVGRMARWMEAAAYRSADSIGVICSAFERHLRASGVPADKIVFFPNYIDTRALKPAPRMGGFRSRHNLTEQDFVVMYSGGMAQKQGLETLVAAAGMLPQMRFFLIGEGPSKCDLEELVRERSLANVVILPLQPKATLAEQLSAADVLVITQKRDVTDAVFPSKLLPYMACERPVVATASMESETARFITSHNIGIVATPEDPAALADALTALAQNPELATGLGQNGRRTVSSMFERDAVLSRMNELVSARFLRPQQERI